MIKHYTKKPKVKKTSKKGCKIDETRATFIVNETQLEQLKALAYWDRVTIKDIMADLINDYIFKRKEELEKVLKTIT